jgi:prefoldin subunit 5
MGNSIQDKSSQKEYIKNRIDLLVEVLDSIDAETAGIDEIDKIISMLDDLELKCKQFRHDWDEK